MQDAPRKVLIIRLSAIGDVLRVLPAFQVLRKNYPDASFGWVTEEGSADILRAHPEIDNVFVFPKKAISRKLDRMEQVIDAVTYRLESLEDMREDLWPMVQGASHQISVKLHELEQRGAVGFAREAVKVGERIVTSLTEEDVRLLGENVVHILHTVRNLTQPEVLEIMSMSTP